MHIVHLGHSSFTRGCVLSIGNFDGLHLGHQALIVALKEVAITHQVPPMLMTFEPLPKEWFQRRGVVSRLMSFSQKCQAMHVFGIDQVACMPFGRLVHLSAEDFVKTILVDRLGVRAIVEGDDFRFGAKRAGDMAYLTQLGKKYGFDVITVPPILAGGERISSSRIRATLAAQQLEVATQLLGRPYTFRGKVVRGDQRGRTLGFPTANLRVRPWAMPVSGVMAVRVSGAGLVHHPGVASLGTRPMFEGGFPLLEVHLFDITQDLYGSILEVQLCHYLRSECMFSSVSDLVAQMHRDAEQARIWLK